MRQVDVENVKLLEKNERCERLVAMHYRKAEFRQRFYKHQLEQMQVVECHANHNLNPNPKPTPKPNHNPNPNPNPTPKPNPNSVVSLPPLAPFNLSATETGGPS